MKIKHDITLTSKEIDYLFNMVLPACMADYQTVADQTAALDFVKAQFDIELTKYLSKAFKVGKKMGKVNADVEDSKMYEVM